MKGTAEQSEAKNHPVNGFLVPRAGGDTAPVSPDESLSLRQRKIPSFEGIFAFLGIKEKGMRRERPSVPPPLSQI